MLNEWPILSLLLWFPIAGAALLWFFPERFARNLALGVTLVTLFLCLGLLWHFDPSVSFFQWTESREWIPAFGIRYELGIDGIALALLLLTALCAVLVVIASFHSVTKQVPFYLSCLLLLQGLMNGVFVSVDVFLFYVFWEAMLIPMFLLIGIWGGVNRIYATIKFFLYTFLGSVLMLIALLYLFNLAGSSKLTHFYPLKLTLSEQKWLFLAFFAAFSVKIPMWPVHTWLPDAHVEAPTGGSVILAAIMLKIGAFGFLRFALPILPDACVAFAPFMIFLSLVAVVYVGMVAIVQQDMKKLIAYSSIAHMGFVTLGLFLTFFLVQGEREAVAQLGIQGAIVQMISHGFISAALFLCVGVLYDRLHSRQIKDYGGVVHSMPIFASLFLFFAMANAGLPGTSGFVGEFFVILSAAKVNFWIAAVAATTLLWGAAYTLWMYKRVVWGPVQNPNVASLKDLWGKEFLVLGIFAVCVLALGLYPEPLTHLIHSSVSQLAQDILRSKFS